MADKIFNLPRSSILCRLHFSFVSAATVKTALNIQNICWGSSLPSYMYTYCLRDRSRFYPSRRLCAGRLDFGCGEQWRSCRGLRIITVVIDDIITHQRYRTDIVWIGASIVDGDDAARTLIACTVYVCLRHMRYRYAVGVKASGAIWRLFEQRNVATRIWVGVAKPISYTIDPIAKIAKRGCTNDSHTFSMISFTKWAILSLVNRPTMSVFVKFYSNRRGRLEGRG